MHVRGGQITEAVIGGIGLRVSLKSRLLGGIAKQVQDPVE
jgi:hypothetical protein